MGNFYLRRLAYKKVRKKFIGRGILISVALLGSIGFCAHYDPFESVCREGV